MSDEKEIKQVFASIGYKCVVVQKCPYCGKSHRHGPNTRTGDIKTADCLLGQYQITLFLCIKAGK